MDSVYLFNKYGRPIGSDLWEALGRQLDCAAGRLEPGPPGLPPNTANVNPFTLTVDAMRSLWLGAPAGNSVWGAVAWAVGILFVFAPLAVRRYRQIAGH